jgi:ketosteroid isomerase-like protein
MSAVAQTFNGDKAEIDSILDKIKDFSQYYMNADYQNLANCYTTDGKIFPNNTDIIEGTEAIKKRWTLPENVKIVFHKATPLEITIENNTAYDYGYYEGETLRPDGTKTKFKGKYVIVWKKVNDDWKIYLDIWNNL